MENLSLIQDRPNHILNVLKELKTFKKQELFTDCTIICQEKQYAAHRLILSSCSSYFKHIFEQAPCSHPILIISEMDPQDLEVLLNYMYDGKASILQSKMSSLFKEGQALKIKGFTSNELTISIEPREIIRLDSHVFPTISTPKQPSIPVINQNSNQQLDITESGENRFKMQSYFNISDTTESRDRLEKQSNMYDHINPPINAPGQIQKHLNFSKELQSNCSLKEGIGLKIALNRPIELPPSQIGQQKRTQSIITQSPIPLKKIKLPNKTQRIEKGNNSFNNNSICIDQDNTSPISDICKEEIDPFSDEASNQSIDYSNLSSLLEEDVDSLKLEIESFIPDSYEASTLDTSLCNLSQTNQQDIPILHEPSSSSLLSPTKVHSENDPMREDSIQALLTSRGLESCVQIFKEHGITLHILESLSDFKIKELCPKIGHQIKVRCLIEDLLKTKKRKKKINLNALENIKFDRKDITQERIIAVLGQKNGKLLRKCLSEDYVVNIKDKHALNRILTDWLCLQTKGYPSRSLKLVLAQVICEVFPVFLGKNDSPYDLWFQPRSNNGKVGGLIEMRVQNWRKNLQDKDKKYKKTHQPSVLDSSELSLINREEGRREMLKKKFGESQELVWERMEATFHLRRKEFMSLKVDEALREWPHMKKETFINLDYEMLMKNESHNSDCLKTEFSLKAPKIIQLSLEKDKKEELCHLQLKDMEEGMDSYTNKALFCLPFLLPQGMVRMSNPSAMPEHRPARTKFVRPSYADSIHHFIRVLPEGTDIERYTQEKQTDGRPLVVVTGSAANPVDCFLLAGKTSIRCSSLVTAVDLCFKMYHLCNLKYPKFAKNTFIFLEKYFYKLKSSWTIPTCVFDLYHCIQ